MLLELGYQRVSDRTDGGEDLTAHIQHTKTAFLLVII